MNATRDEAIFKEFEMRLTRNQRGKQISTKGKLGFEENPFQEIHPRMFRRKGLNLPPIKACNRRTVTTTSASRTAAALSWSANFNSQYKNDSKIEHMDSKNERTTTNDMHEMMGKRTQTNLVRWTSISSYRERKDSALIESSREPGFIGQDKEYLGDKSVTAALGGSLDPSCGKSHRMSTWRGAVTARLGWPSVHVRSYHFIPTEKHSQTKMKSTNLSRHRSSILDHDASSTGSTMNRQLLLNDQSETDKLVYDRSHFGALGLIVKPKLHRSSLLTDEEIMKTSKTFKEFPA